MTSETLKQVIPTPARPEDILAVILDPLRLPEWSLFTKSVQDKAASYVTQILSGPREFYWFVDPKNVTFTVILAALEVRHWF